jgi:hypothetical protein
MEHNEYLNTRETYSDFVAKSQNRDTLRDLPNMERVLRLTPTQSMFD